MLSKQGRWTDMADAVDDTMLHAFAVVGDPATVGTGISERFGQILTRATFYAPYAHDPSIWADVLNAARSSQTQAPAPAPAPAQTTPEAQATQGAKP